MADQDDFAFDEQDSDSEDWYEEEPEKKGGSRSRLLLLLLLLVVIAGGAYFYFVMMPADEGPAAPTKKVVKLKKKAVTMPAKPKPVQMPVKKDAEPAPKMAEKAEAKPDEKADATTADKTAPAKPPVEEKVAEKPAAPVAAPVKAAEKPVVEKPVAEEPAKLPPTPQQVFEKPAEKKPLMAASGGAYSLTAGTFLLDSSVKNVAKKIRALGYEAVMTPVKRNVKMTRLKLGTFSKSEAATRLAELKMVAPGAFSIRSGNSETVYAGSYLVLDKARRFADVLYRKGVKVEEVPVEVTKTMQRVTFGAFATTDEAKAAARQAAGKGVEAQVYKNR